MRIDSFRPANAAHGIALLHLLVALVEREPVRDLFNCIAVEINFEFVHTFRMVARGLGVSESGRR